MEFDGSTCELEISEVMESADKHHLIHEDALISADRDGMDLEEQSQVAQEAELNNGQGDDKGKSENPSGKFCHLGQVLDKVETHLSKESKIPRGFPNQVQRQYNEKSKSMEEPMSKMVGSEQVCSTRVFDGQQYDLRCIYCKVLPREGSLARSELYRHYAIHHFGEKLKSDFGNLLDCPICGVDLRNSSVRSHLGQVHDKVQKYLPEEAKIPRGLLQPRGRHARMKTSGSVGHVGSKASKKPGVFPAIPENFRSGFESQQKDKKADNEMKGGPLVVDGFTIEEEVVEEEAEEFGHPHCDEKLKCAICDKMFGSGGFNQAVLHLKGQHGVRGFGMQLNLSMLKLISAGYRQICRHS